jgi:hypothetical protein
MKGLVLLSHYSDMDSSFSRTAPVSARTTRRELDFIQEQAIAPIQRNKGKRITFARTGLAELHNPDSTGVIETQGHLPGAITAEPEIFCLAGRRRRPHMTVFEAKKPSGLQMEKCLRASWIDTFAKHIVSPNS